MQVLIEAPENLSVKIAMVDGIMQVTVTETGKKSLAQKEAEIVEAPLARRFVETEKTVEELPKVKAPVKRPAKKRVALTPEMRKAIRSGIYKGKDNKTIAAEVGCDGRQVQAIRRFTMNQPQPSTLVHSTDATESFGEYR